MHATHLYEYAIIRVVPRVEREEFINIGLLLFCKRQKYLRMHYILPTEKINLFDVDFDCDLLKTHLESIAKICSGDIKGGPIATLDTAERFRWLTAVKSSSIQTSRPHAGLTDDLDATFERLIEELVL